MSVALVAGLLLSLAPATQTKPDGFLALPKSGHGHGVLVLHPWWGLNADVKAFTRRLAAAGYVAYAPDLFGGRTAKTRTEAIALLNTVQSAKYPLKALVRAAAKSLAERTGENDIAVVGFSFGAPLALELSNDDPARVRAVVVYYGTGQADFSRSKAAYLGHFAEKDEFEPKAGVDGLAKFLHDAGRPATFDTYPKTGHWFAEPSVKAAYDKAAADLAWGRTLSFLRQSFATKED